MDIYHSMIYLENNDFLVFGNNDYGQLGLGHNHDQKCPVKLMNAKIKMISLGGLSFNDLFRK